MIDISNIKNIYFIGAGGIGMSAIERYFIAKGARVSGYDKTATALSKQLEAEGVKIVYEDDINLLDKAAALVVYTPAIPALHQQLNWYKNNGYPVVKRSDVLQLITQNTFNICVAGTHGKTTISTMISHLLRHTGFGCNAFLGGISTNYNTNFWSSSNDVAVVEADEYDRSFLKLSPNISVVTAMDADHLDIYGTVEAMQDAFIEFANKTKRDGLLIRHCSLHKMDEAKVARQITYGLHNPLANVHVTRMVAVNGNYELDVQYKEENIKGFLFKIGGLHNVENALVAICVAKQLGIDNQKIKAAIEAFTGVKRRFEYIIKNEEHVLIDDYAHHPQELQALISGVKDLYPATPICIVFQPHLFSRTKDFAKAFAASLSMADEVFLLPIYPARELPIEGVTSHIILEKMTIEHKQILSKEELMDWIQNHKPKLLVLAGAGDIDAMVEPIAAVLNG